MRKLLSIILVVVLCLTMSVPGFAQQPIQAGGVRYQPFIDQGLSADTVVAYFEGTPILAKDVDETGFFDSSHLPMQRASASANFTVASANYNKAIFVEGTLSVPSFSQTEMYTYLPNKCIADLCYSLRNSNVSEGVNFLLSCIPRIGPAIGVAVLVNTMLTNNRVTELNNLRVAGKRALYLVINSPYGNVASVREWDGWTIAANSYSTNKGTYVERYNVTQIQYGVKV